MRYLKVVKIGIWMWAVLGILPAQTTAQPCGGVDRWAVKVGADADASLIDVSSPTTTLLHDLVRLLRPQKLPPQKDPLTRLPEERTVRVVDGRLIKFRLETGKHGDSDYHLVVSDDSLQFSTGPNSVPPSPHSFVAEIVDPDCVSGRSGTSPVPSVFVNQLTAVHAKFLKQFPNIDEDDWNETGGMPVKITGVGFFDRQHGQTGRALNGIELHPILDIDFQAGSNTPTSLPVLQNPGFEDGEKGWTATPEVVSNTGPEQPRSGKFKAWLGGLGETHTDRLSQVVSLPSSAKTITLTFFLHVSTDEQNTQVFDRLTVRLRRPNGQFLKTLATFTNLQAGEGYDLKSFDLTQFLGQAVKIELEAREDNGSQTSFVVDDFAIVIE